MLLISWLPCVNLLLWLQRMQIFSSNFKNRRIKKNFRLTEILIKMLEFKIPLTIYRWFRWFWKKHLWIVINFHKYNCFSFLILWYFFKQVYPIDLDNYQKSICKTLQWINFLVSKYFCLLSNSLFIILNKNCISL